MKKNSRKSQVAYEVYGSFLTPRMKFNLSVTERFALLADARHCREMLKRGGCKTAIHMVTTRPETRTWKRVH